MPLIRIENDQAREGFLLELSQRLASNVGRTLKLIIIPRPRLIRMLEQGTVDVHCNANAAWLKTINSHYVWSRPLMIQRDLLISRDAQPFDLDHLHGERVGTVRGFSYPVLQPYFDSGQLQRDDARTQEQVLNKLAAKRYNYAVSSKHNFDWYNKSKPVEQHFKQLQILKSFEIACLVRDSPDIPTQAILSTLAAMKSSGEIDQLFSRYR